MVRTFVLVVLLFVLALAQPQGQAQTAPIPTIRGPITGPGEMYPALRSVPAGTSVADMKYGVKEYFVSGTANGKPYTTRILVRQPDDMSKFSGIVVAEPMHASGNSWMFYYTRIYMMRSGHISLEIDPQKDGTEATVVQANPERYKVISIAEMAQTNEILAQVGALIKGNGATSPIKGVRRLLMMGTSQSAGTLRGYLPAHAAWRMPDGKPIYDGFFPTSTAGMPIPKVDVPLIQLATQTELTRGLTTNQAHRRPDGDTPGDQFRLYEVSGMPHNDSRENPTYAPNPCKMPVPTYPVGALMSMGLRNLVQWVDKGTVPPRAERMAVENGNFVLDAQGNVKGGVRSTYVDVPMAKYSTPNNADPKPGTRDDFYCGIAGVQQDLAAEQLKSLYKDQAAYRNKVKQRLDELTKGGWFLQEYASQVTGDAEKVRF